MADHLEVKRGTVASDASSIDDQLMPVTTMSIEEQIQVQPPETLSGRLPVTSDPRARPYTMEGFFPSSDMAHFLLKEYLVDFNQAVSLTRPDALVANFRAAYTYGSAAELMDQIMTWTVLAIAHRLRGMSPLQCKQDEALARVYLRRAMAALPDLLMSKPTLRGIQCIVGMAVVVHGLEAQEAALSLLATALRMTETMAASSQWAGSDPSEIEQTRLVYWIAVFMDTDLCIRWRRRPAGLHDGVGMALPMKGASAGDGLIDLDGARINVIHLRSRLAQIQSLILSLWIFPSSSPSRSDLEYAQRDDLLTQLRSWRQHAVFRLDPKTLMKKLDRSDSMHVRVLEAAYFNSLVALCTETEDESKAEHGRALRRVSPSYVTYCLGDARRLLRMLAFFPDGEHAALW